MTIAVDGFFYNSCLGWNNGFCKLVGHSYPIIWRAIDSIQKDQPQVATLLSRDDLGEPPAKRVCRQTRQLQINEQNMCADRRDGTKSAAVTLQGIRHCGRLSK